MKIGAADWKCLLLVVIGLHAAGLRAAEDTPEGQGTTRNNFFRKLLNLPPKGTDGTNASPLASLTAEDFQGGVKQALKQGVLAAVGTLGRTNGFLTNLNVRIPFPPQLSYLEQGLRKLGQDQLIDEFQVALNRAAEKAVPEAAAVLMNTLEGLSIQDAARLITSKSETAATDYFREHSSRELLQRFLPIVREATASAGVTAAYKQLLEKVPLRRFGFFSRGQLDIDGFVAAEALDGLFVMVAEEEKRIRENPAARGTELLEKVFGAVKASTGAR